MGVTSFSSSKVALSKGTPVASHQALLGRPESPEIQHLPLI
jgi:hypothetical protein